MSKNNHISYQRSGIDYSKIDPIKVLAQKAAWKTAQNLPAGVTEVSESRGESAYVLDIGDAYIASITECLGTKVVIADMLRKLTGKTYYENIAQDTVAMAVNDLLTVGAKPLSIHAYWATGDSAWFDDQERIHDLVRGWKKACYISGASWGGGETPTLKGIVRSRSIDMAASCVGIIKPKKHLILGKKLEDGDIIVLLESSGIHANGLSLAREIFKKVPKEMKTLLGEALLIPTLIYSKVMEALLSADIDIHYVSNITGHGWRKIMRHPEPYTYRITKIPKVPPALQFMVDFGPIGLKEAYGNLNMGAGYALFVAPDQAQTVLDIATKNGVKAIKAGKVERGDKKVVIEPVHVTFKDKSLKLRG